MDEAIRLIVGLGNPGERYAKTRHNVGAWFVEKIAEHDQLLWREEKKFFGHYCQISKNGQNFWLLKPSTYMNESGKAVAAFAKFYKLNPPSILVAHDELDFPAGIVRIKSSGGAGGHNGLKSLVSYLQTPDFCRLRIGIGHPGHRDDVVPYVLNEPSRNDLEKIFKAIDCGIQIVPDLFNGDIQKAFRILHSSD